MKNFNFLPKEKISDLPKTSGVYIFLKNKEIIYIGKATNIKERVKSYFQQPAHRDTFFINQITKIGYIKTDSEIEALILEANLIKKYQPRYNIVWRDDKNYFFVGITKENFPRIFWTHQLKAESSKLKANFIGPFVDGKALKQTLKVLRKVFPYRSCKTLPNRPCLWYHLEQCPAPCLLKSKMIKEIPLDSLKIKKSLQKNAKNLIKIFKEGKNPILRELKREMKLASKNQDFETAAKIRNQIFALEKVLTHSKIFEKISYIKMPWQKSGGDWMAVEEQLKKILKKEGRISRIEAYDVSNIAGQQATGSIVTFIDGLPEKNFYRRFKIKIAGKPNDVAMLKEILVRRLKHPEWGFPDLILIDGGKGQLNAVCQVLRRLNKSSLIKVLALAKKKNKLYFENKKYPILLKSLPREIFNLILQLRDEAHRFALTYHKKLRERELIS